MKPHFRFRRFVISCLNLVVCYTLSGAEAWAETQNLSCEATSLTWDTQSPVFADADGKAASFAAGDNVSFLGETKVTLGEDISAGCINITTGANVSINLADYELSAERITLSGTLEYGDSLSIGEGAALVVAAPSAVLKSDLILADAGTLAVGAAANLSGSSLTLQGGTDFSLSGSALTSADGRVYNIFTGVGALLGGGESALSLSETDNAISLYFDATRPGSGFWANSTLQLTADGALQLVRHTEAVKDGVEYTSRQYGSFAHSYYKSVVFSGISHDLEGGAIYGLGYITLSNNDSVSFSGNSVSGSSSARGGAIAGDGYIIALSNNGRVSFIGNSAVSNHNFTACGGAIYATYELSIRNNDTVLFEKNAEVEDGTYRLRSIYATGRGVEVSLSAAAEKSIEFRDSVYVDSLSTIKLNKDYKDVDGTVHKQEGDIVFTGGYTEKNLNELLSANNENRKATKKEITNSRTSEMHGEVTLYGGRLRVEEKAVLKTTAGLTVAEDSNATVKVDNAELDADESDITIGATGKLELSDVAIVRANSVIIDENASLALSGSEMQAYTTFALRSEAVPAAFSSYHTDNSVLIDANLTLNGGSTLLVDNAHICMTDSSVLTFNASDDKKINLVLTLGAVYESDVPIVLFSEVNSISFIYNDRELTAGEGVNVGDFFTGEWINEETTFTYDAETGTIFAMNVNSLSVPEPTTATLSLLALAALAVRRRRW